LPHMFFSKQPSSSFWRLWDVSSRILTLHSVHDADARFMRARHGGVQRLQFELPRIFCTHIFLVPLSFFLAPPPVLVRRNQAYRRGNPVRRDPKPGESGGKCSALISQLLMKSTAALQVLNDTRQNISDSSTVRNFLMYFATFRLSDFPTFRLSASFFPAAPQPRI